MPKITIDLPEKARIHLPLHSSFVELLPLLKFLSTDIKHCIVKLIFSTSLGYLFMTESRLMHAVYDGEELIMGLEGIETLKSQIINENALIDIFTMSPSNIERMAIASLEYIATLRYDDLSTEFVSLDKILDDCKKETLTGFIKVKGQNPSYILIDEGNIVSTVYGSESTCIRGDRAFDYISKLAKETKLLLNIFTVDKNILEMIHGQERAGKKWLESIKIKKSVKSLPDAWDQTQKMIFYLADGKRSAAEIYEKITERNIRISVKAYLDELKSLQQIKKIKVIKG